MPKRNTTKTEFEKFLENHILREQANIARRSIFNTEDLDARQNARQYAMVYASQTPGLRDRLNPERDIKDPDKLAEYLGIAVEQYTRERDYSIDKERFALVHTAPREGLVGALYGLSPEPVKDRSEYKKIVEYHERIAELTSILEGIKEGKVNPQDLITKIGPELMKSIQEGFKESRVLRDDEEFQKRIFNAAYTSLNNEAAVHLAANIRGNMIKSMEEELGSEENKAQYVKAILLAEKDKEKIANYFAIVGELAARKAAERNHAGRKAA